MRIIYRHFQVLPPNQIKACTSAIPLTQGFQGFLQTSVKPRNTLAELEPAPSSIPESQISLKEMTRRVSPPGQSQSTAKTRTEAESSDFQFPVLLPHFYSFL